MVRVCIVLSDIYWWIQFKASMANTLYNVTQFDNTLVLNGSLDEGRFVDYYTSPLAYYFIETSHPVMVGAVYTSYSDRQRAQSASKHKLIIMMSTFFIVFRLHDWKEYTHEKKNIVYISDNGIGIVWLAIRVFSAYLGNCRVKQGIFENP